MDPQLKARDAPAPRQTPKNPDPEGSDRHHIAFPPDLPFTELHRCRRLHKGTPREPQPVSSHHLVKTLQSHGSGGKKSREGEVRRRGEAPEDGAIHGEDLPAPEETVPSSSRRQCCDDSALLRPFAAPPSSPHSPMVRPVTCSACCYRGPKDAVVAPPYQERPSWGLAQRRPHTRTLMLACAQDEVLSVEAQGSRAWQHADTVHTRARPCHGEVPSPPP
jgi:hypothetical protein